jgi:DNA primase
MAIPEKTIDQIQEKTDIVELISGYAPLKKAGRNYKAPCPFHNEKTPSFIVSPDKQIYHCFGCGAGGNVFSFLMRIENLQFPEAVEMLAEKAGIVVPRSAGARQGEDPLAAKIYAMNEAACGFFQDCLAGKDTAREYLVSRGVGDETIKKFRIGYAPDAWEGLLTFFRKKNFDLSIIEKSGLAIPNDKGGRYDRFRNRIIFPIIDLKNRVLGFGARVLDSSLPKYINSPETPVYSKGRNLYGLNFSKDAIRAKNYALIVEGYLDFLIPYQAGAENIIATLGTALTTDQIKLLKRFASTVIMVYDPDEAGEAASLRNLDLFIGEDVNVYIAELPKGLDPDSFIRKNGAEEFNKLIKSGKNLFDYKLDKLMKRFDMRTAHGKAGIVGEMLPTISRINNAVVKSELIKKLAQRLSIDIDAVKEEMKKVKQDYSKGRYTVTPVEARKDSRTAEMIILALMIESADLVGKVIDLLPAEEYRNSTVRDIATLIYGMHRENRAVNPARLINHLGTGTEASAIVSEAASMLEFLTDKEKTLNDCVARIKKDNIQDRLNALQARIRTAHGKQDEATWKELVTEYDSLERLKRKS